MSNFRMEDEFVPRTKKNLELVLEHKDLGFHEVTQLMNSMVGLLIFPQQRYFSLIEQLRLDDFPTKNWPIPKIFLWGGVPFNSQDLDKETITLQEIVRYMRHSVSHATFEFESTGMEIERVRFTNLDPRSKKKTIFSYEINEFKEFILQFVGTMQIIISNQQTTTPKDG
jgi:hypothetical protein